MQYISVLSLGVKQLDQNWRVQ